VIDFLLRFFVERVTAISDSMFIYNRDSEIDIVPETIGMVRKRIDVFSAIGVELR
jgi:hypothetical protein